MPMKLDLPLSTDTKTRFASQLFAHLENRSTDLAPSTMSVAPSFYFDQTLAAREREEIFGSVPIVVCHGSEIPQAGDFLTAQLPNNRVVVVRHADGSVKTMVNVCRHRGAQVVMAECGNARVFSCGYHGWTYNRDGGLRSIAQPDTFGDADRACLGLVELPCEERHGMVWVVDSAGASIDVAEWLGEEMDESLSSFDLAGYSCYRVGNFDEPINWKTLMDAFLDAYHITATHSGSVAPYFYNNIQVWEPLGRHGRTISPRKSIDQVKGMAPGSASIDNHITVAHFFMPNMSLLRQPDHFELLNFVPHPQDAGRCRMQMRLLVNQPVETDDDRRHWDKNWDILMSVLRDEDLVLNRALQEAMQSKDAQPLLLGRNEIVNQYFHAWLDRAHDDPRHWG